jgi:hypothetical protein
LALIPYPGPQKPSGCAKATVLADRKEKNKAWHQFRTNHLMKEPKKNRRTYLLSWLFLALLFACRTDKNKSAETPPLNPERTMKATIQRLHHFQHIPSASGMEIIGNRLYVVGDDSPFLYVLDLASLLVEDQIRLFESGDFGSGRIPKLLKPDLECLTRLDMNGASTLVAFGSGSTPNRARGYSIQLPAGNQEGAQVQSHSLSDLYQALQADEDLLGNDVLNLEAAAATPDKLLLLQRATQAGTNLLLSFPRQEFVSYMSGTGKKLPGYEAISFHLPDLAGLPARFSGAVAYHDKLFVTASVENTTDAILDGEVLGSFVGWIELDAVKGDRGLLELHTALVTDGAGKPYPGKVESLVILDSPRPHTFRALAMTDNDQGQSDLLELELTLVAGPGE